MLRPAMLVLCSGDGGGGGSSGRGCPTVAKVLGVGGRRKWNAAQLFGVW